MLRFNDFGLSKKEVDFLLKCLKKIKNPFFSGFLNSFITNQIELDIHIIDIGKEV